MRGKSTPRKLVRVAALVWVTAVLVAIWFYTGRRGYIGGLGSCAFAMFSLNLFSTASPRQPGKHARSASVVTQLAVDQVGLLSLKVKELTARLDRTDGRVKNVFRTLAETNAEAGYDAPDLEETRPRLTLIKKPETDDRQDEAG